MWNWLKKLFEEDDGHHHRRDAAGHGSTRQTNHDAADIYGGRLNRRSDESTPTAPMVEALRELWDIDTSKKKVEHPPPNVDTDIYNVASPIKPVPRRSSPRRERRWRDV